MAEQPQFSIFEFRVSQSGERLDPCFLRRQMPDWSRSQVLRLIRSGLVSVGARLARKGGEEVQAGDIISVRAGTRRADGHTGGVAALRRLRG